jgi:hypothetical protein
MQPTRDHLLPPDVDAYRHAEHPHGRIIVIAPTRAACETIELAVQAHVDTLLEREHGATIRHWAREPGGFGIVAGTGTGKTLGIRVIAEEILAAPLRVGVVNREREATADTPTWNLVIVTTGIARRWLSDDLITRVDTIVVDEIHQTSAELELCLALGKRAGCRFIWLSATVDPAVYRTYLDSEHVLETSAFDPARRARVSVVARQPAAFLDDRTMRHFISQRRGVAVFLPTRAEVERLGAEVAERYPRLTTAFYHGGEPVRVLRPFLEGEVRKPYLLAMTAAGQSALNLPGLDTVVIYDARYGNVVEHGHNVLHRLYLGPNEILQMAGRVHGRVAGGEVTILSDRDLDFDSLRPGPPEFQLAGDAEQVALTCAAIGVDATDLDLPVPLDRSAYLQAMRRLTRRGLIDGGRLTRYGRQVEAIPVDRAWAELLLHATAEQLPVVAGASGIDSLHRMTRDTRDLHGVLVAGSDHLTAYNLLVEAINRCARIGEVHGLRRHVFDELELSAWADRRGVLVKAIEDGALGMASAYRALDATLPDVLPPAGREPQAGFIDLVARIEPFDLVLDEMTADGQPARIAKSSVAGSWGAIAGRLRYFADRMGVARAAIEGTTLPYDVIRQYAVSGPASVMIVRHKHRQELAVTRPLEYFGFALDTARERVTGRIPDELVASARDAMVAGITTGTIDHPSARRVTQAIGRLDEYWRRSGGAMPGIDAASARELIAAQLADVTSWDELQQTPIAIDVDALIPSAERHHLDQLPASLHLRGDAAALHYEMRDGKPLARVMLREGQARRLRDADLPVLDRPLVFAVRRRGAILHADTLTELHALLDRPDTTVTGKRAGSPDGSSRRGHGGGRGPAPRGRRRR